MATPTGKVKAFKSASAAGFSIITDDRIPRLVTSAEAPEKTGKTHQLAYMPLPMAVISMDSGTRATLTPWAAANPGQVQIKNIRSAKSLKEDEVNLKGCRETLEELRDSIATVLNCGDFRSLGVDTGTDVHELVKMALHGKTTQIMQFAYGAINDLTKEVFAPVISHESMNAHLIHRVKKEYKGAKTGSADSSWTGNWELAGLAEVRYMTDLHFVNVYDATYKDEDTGQQGAFGLQVGRSRYNPLQLNSQTFWHDEAQWKHLASLCWPDTDASWWD